MADTEYTNAFYDKMQNKNIAVARLIMPILIDSLQPKSIIDLGCGRGLFLRIAKDMGINVMGVDGDYVDRNELFIEAQEFIPANLEKELIPPKKFDLAISFEVAEHLPENCAKLFVDNLIKCADVVAFSAAVPFQGGDTSC